MSRVSPDTMVKLKAFFDSLPDEARSKCALCNETLTHIVKKAEAQTGAGTRTVCRELAERHNETAAPMDKVSEGRLRDRVRIHDGSKSIGEKIPNNPAPPPEQHVPSQAINYANLAINMLSRIDRNDPQRSEALGHVIDWINESA